MSLLIPKIAHGSGGGWETNWYCTSKSNWLYKVIYDSDKNVMKIWILHNTKTHLAVPDYIGDEKCCDRDECTDTYPIFQCPICERKSKGANCREMFDIFLKWYIKKAEELNAKLLINENKDEIVNNFIKEEDKKEK